MTRDEGSLMVGYFAATSSATVLSEGSARVVAGSREAMRRYVRQSSQPVRRYAIRQIRLHEILEGISGGEVYAFDHSAWERGRPWLERHAMSEVPLQGAELGIPVVRITPGIWEAPVI